MDWQSFPYLIPYIISLAVTCGLALFVYQRRRMPGANTLFVMLLGESLWTFGYIFEQASFSLEAKLWWDDFQFIGTFLLPPAFLIFALEYSASRMRYIRRRVVLASLPLLAILLLILAAPTSPLVRPDYRLVAGQPFNILVYDYGIPLWISFLYSYAFTLVAVLLLGSLLVRQRRVQLTRTLLILIGVCIPLVGTLLSLAGVSLSGQRDFTPFTFALGNLVIAWGLLRFRLFDTAPLGRDTVVQNLADPVFTFDNQDRLVDLNPAAEDLLRQSAFSAVGDYAGRLLPFWKDLPVPQGQQGVIAEIHLPVGRTCEASLAPVLDKTGFQPGRVLVLHDITARKQGEAELRQTRDGLEQRVVARTAELAQAVERLEGEVAERRQAELALGESEEKFRAMIEQSSESFVLVDEVGFVIEVNQAYESMFGIPRRQIIGRPFWEIIARVAPDNAGPDLEERVRRSILESVRTGQSSLFNHPIEVMVSHPDGSPRWILQSVFPIHTRAGFRLASISRDITEMKLADLALAESEEKFRTVIEQSSDGFLLLDETGLIIATNEAYHTFTGLRREELLGRRYVEVAAGNTTPEVASRIQESLLQVLENGDASNYPRNIEAATTLPDGRILYLLQTIFPIHTSRGLRLASFTRDISEQKLAQQRVQAELDKLNSLRLIDASITSGRGLEYNLNVVLEQAAQHLGSDAGRILLLDQAGQQLTCAAWQGFTQMPSDCPQHNDSHSLAWTAVLGGKRVACRVGESPAAMCDCFEVEGFQLCIAVPLVVQGGPKGALEVFLRRPFTPGPDWLNYLDTLAGQAAVAVDNAWLVRDLQRTNSDLIEAYEATIAGWSQALELRDKETKGHSERVTRLATELGRRLGLSSEELVHFRRGVLLHDIGKMAIPDSILLKPGPLSEDEWVVMHQHVQYAFNLLAGIPYLKPAIEVPLCHHEHWDGTGYPRGLKGEEIPLGARIFAVLDVWDALSSDRPYRPAWERPAVVHYIRALSGKQFDPHVVTAFLELIGESRV